jgi:hypothetical protein
MCCVRTVQFKSLRRFVIKSGTKPRRCINSEPFRNSAVSIPAVNMIEQFGRRLLFRDRIAVLNLWMTCSYLEKRNLYVDWLGRNLSTVNTDAHMFGQNATACVPNYENAY